MMIRMMIWFVVLCFSLETVFYSTPTFASLEVMPVRVPSIKGIQILSSGPMKLSFLFDEHARSVSPNDIEKTIRMFMAGLTLEPSKIWVNLSPYEPKRIMPSVLSVTDLGQAMAQQDYLLKQRASSLTNPDGPIGREFWARVIGKRKNVHGSIETSVNIFPKVWIVPDRAVVYHLGNRAMLGEMHLKVLAEQDYLATRQQTKGQDNDDTNIIREVICPMLEKEVNASEDFAPLRQMYQALVLSSWFKTYHGHLLPPGYAQQSKVRGIDVIAPHTVKGIYDQYRYAYKKGAYNFIREEVDASGLIKARKYFSGGLTFEPKNIRFVDAPRFSNPWQWLKRTFTNARLVGVSVVFAAILSSTENAQAASNYSGLNQEQLMTQKTKLSDQLYARRITPHNFTVERSHLDAALKKIIKPIAQKEKTILPAVGRNESRLGGLGEVSKGAAVLPIKQIQDIDLPQENKPPLKYKSVDILRRVVASRGLVVESPQKEIKSVADLPPIKMRSSKTADSPTGAGSPPKDKWAELMTQSFSANEPPPVLINTNKAWLNVSSRGELGYALGEAPGLALNSDLQIEKNFKKGFSMYGGLRLDVMPQRQENEMTLNDDPMAPPPNFKTIYDAKVMPYVGLHKAGSSFEYFAEWQDPRSIQLGFEHRNVYYKGLSYTYGLSGIGYDSPDGYMVGAMAQGYASLRLAQIFPGQSEILEKTYLSSSLKLAVAQQGVGLGGDLRLTYNNRWWVFGELSPMRDLPFMLEAFGHHGGLHSYGLGAGFRISEQVNTFLEWGQMIGHMQEKSKPNFLFGLQYEFGRRSLNHNNPNPSIDYVRYPLYPQETPAPRLGGSSPGGPPPNKGDKSMIARRDFLKTLALGAGSLGSSETMFGQPPDDVSQRIDAVYASSVDSVCSEPVVTLEVGAPLKVGHRVYLAFMFWYLKDPSNDWIEFSSPGKKALLNFDALDWEEEMLKTEVSLSLLEWAKTVEAKLKAEALHMKRPIASKDEIPLDGEVFPAKLRNWLDRYIPYLRRREGVRIDFDEIMQELKKAQIAFIQSSLKNFVKIEDVRALMKERGEDPTALQEAYWNDFFEDNPPYVIFAAQKKLSKLKDKRGNNIYEGPIDGKANRAMYRAFRTLMKKDNAQTVMPGGIDFSNVPQSIEWRKLDKKQSDFSNSKEQVLGLTFRILEVKSLTGLDFSM